MSSRSRLSDRPKVSIICISYNQEKYIRQTLESFVTQKTNFKFEIVISDDASSDKTPEIINEYTEKYPDLFKTTLREKNLGPAKNFLSTLRSSSGEYISICEGDDFWTDVNKLQLQADFLDKHQDYSMCFHPVKVFFEGGEKKDEIYPDMGKGHKFTVEELLRWNFIQTNSIVYRRQNYANIPEGIMPLDWYLHLFHAQFGKIGYIDKVMGAYRRHPGGIWWDSYNNLERLWRNYGVSYFANFVAILKIYGNNPEYKKIIYNSIDELLSMYSKLNNKDKAELFGRLMKEFPQPMVNVITHQQDLLTKIRGSEHELIVANNTKEEQIIALTSKLGQQEQEVDKLSHEIGAIKSSKAWRARNKVAKIVGKPVV